MYTIAIPGCWSASTGSTKSLAEREIKKANGTIHSPQRKKANICIITNISHFTFNKLLWRSYADHTYVPPEMGTTQQQSTGMPGSGSLVETLQRTDKIHWKFLRCSRKLFVTVHAYYAFFCE